MSGMLLRGGAVAGDHSPHPWRADVLIREGRIAAVEPSIPDAGDAEVIDCAGKVLIPGLFDLHVHLREPGREDEETLESGGRAALHGGITGLIAMPDTTPAIDSGAMLRFVASIAREKTPINVSPAGAITRGLAGTSLAEIGDLAANGARMICEGGRPIRDPLLMRRALEYATGFDLVVGCACEVPELAGDGALNEGRASYRLGLPGIPAVGEEICMERDLRLAQMVGARVHIQSLSTARGLDIVRRFKDEGVAVTAEVSPHHLLYDEDDITGYDANVKLRPPLRTARDREALIEGLCDGSIDAIATGHSPIASHEKKLDFCAAPFGVVGLETALPSLYERFIRSGRFGWDVLVRAFSHRPRALLGLEDVALTPGRAAELVVFDPEVKQRCDRAFFASKSWNSPLSEQTLRGRVEAVIIGGALAWSEAQREPRRAL